jgi:prepilin-type N-terminal cleavage/methylation domain-containing protein
MSRPGSRQFGFSIIELLVVVAIMATLVSIMLPAIASVRRSGKRLVCATQLRSIGQALRMYMDNENHGILPTAGSYFAWDEDRSLALRSVQKYLGAAEFGRKQGEEYVRAAPFACPADNLFWPRHGYSYNYNAGIWMTAMPEFAATDRFAKMATFQFESGEAQGQPVFRDLNFVGHTGGLRSIEGENQLLLDGSVRWKGWQTQSGEPPVLFRPFDP